jgi:hypothetical protein
MTTNLNPMLTVVWRSSRGRPLSARATRRPSTLRVSASRDAAYRRFTATVLGLDVATLAAELRAARLSGERLDVAA